jgi:hypothetical protein
MLAVLGEAWCIALTSAKGVCYDDFVGMCLEVI